MRRVFSWIFGFLAGFGILLSLWALTDNQFGVVAFFLPYASAAGVAAWELRKHPSPPRPPSATLPRPVLAPITPASTEVAGAASLPPPPLDKLAALGEEILADERVDLAEAKRLWAWMDRHPAVADDIRTRRLWLACGSALADGVLDQEEADELRTLLSEICDATAPAGSPTRLWGGYPQVPNTVLAPPKTGDLFEIVYMDSGGEESARRISYRKTSQKGGRTYVHAFCIHRHALRTFRADRILDAVALESGEVIAQPAEYFGAVQ